jgi:hypothetical protein
MCRRSEFFGIDRIWVVVHSRFAQDKGRRAVEGREPAQSQGVFETANRPAAPRGVGGVQVGSLQTRQQSRHFGLTVEPPAQAAQALKFGLCSLTFAGLDEQFGEVQAVVRRIFG